MTLIAIKCGGTIDKFIGDAVMVFFGDPETLGDEQDAIRCVDMALKMKNNMNISLTVSRSYNALNKRSQSERFKAAFVSLNQL